MAVYQQPRQISITTPSEREIRFERIFDAPRDVVWRAFTDPTLISEWWGGGAEVEHMDVRPGGSWKFLGGHMPDGSKFDGVKGLERALLERPELFVGTLTENLLTFALGRGVEPFDGPAVRKIMRDAQADNFRLSSIVVGITASTPFTMRKTP